MVVSPRIFIPILVVLTLSTAGCAQYYWTKPSTIVSDFQTDNFACGRAPLRNEESSEWRGGTPLAA